MIVLTRDWFPKHSIIIDDRRLSVIVFSMFSSWLLSFAFEGQVLYALSGSYNIDVYGMVFGAAAAHFAGLFSCGFFIKKMKSVKKLMIFSIAFCIAGSMPFFFAPSILWDICLFSMSYFAGMYIAAWGFFLKNATPSNGRIKTVADVLILSNILMIIINTAAILLSAYTGLSLAVLMLCASLFLVFRLPEKENEETKANIMEHTKASSLIKPLIFLCLFIVIITINSGLMYQVINPAFEQFSWLVSWYWAIPYIAALIIVRNLPQKFSRAYMLYIAIAMIGFSFISFMILDHSAASYLIIDTLMMGACGVCDLFWWSILGEMLDYSSNPAKIFGIGLSANVLGVLLGGMVGNDVTKSQIQNFNPSMLALVIVFVILIVLPLLHKQLSMLLKNHVYLMELYKMPPDEQIGAVNSLKMIGQLTERECEITALLLKGRTYKMIAGELYLSENTVKTHIKNIYSKLDVNSKMELVNLLMDKEKSLLKQLDSFKLKL